MSDISVVIMKRRIRALVGLTLVSAVFMLALGLQGGAQSALSLGLCLVIVALTRTLFRQLDRLGEARALASGQQLQLAIRAAQIEAASDMILQIDEEGRLLHFNQALCRLTGYSQGELSAARLQEIEPPLYASRFQERLERLREDGECAFESAYQAKDGSLIPVEARARLMPGEVRPVMVTVARDLTRRRRAELRERRRLEVLERIATDAPLEELLAGITRFVEEERPAALCSILLVDDSGARLRHGAAPSLPKEYNGAVDGLLIGRGRGSCGSAAFLKQRVVVEDIEPHPWWKGFQPARDAGLRSCWSEPIVSSSGALLGTVAIYHRTPKYPGAEEILLIESAAHLAGIAIGRVRSDESRRSLEEELRHSQKLEAVGRLAAGVAHDFNNLLTPIIVYADMLGRGFPEGGQQLKMVDAVSRAALKASELTQKLLSFGRKQVLAAAPVDLNEVIASFGDIMRTTVRESIAIELVLSPAAVRVVADRGQLEQVVLNLVVNAQDAISGHGSIRIETGHVILDDEYAKKHPGAVPGAYVLLACGDDGCGMSEETLSRIYEPFFTTKEVGRGTGLGLATIYGIVKHHGGYIEVKSRPGEGTSFEIYLPEAAGCPQTALSAAETALAHPAGEGGVVLLVEDNAMIREMAQELLSSYGYRVLSAALPSQALELAARESRLDLLASDVIMPEMSGPELYDRLLELHPTLPVLYISGYTNNLLPVQSMIPQEATFLAKPFTVEQLLERVHRVISRGPAAGDGMAGGA